MNPEQVLNAHDWLIKHWAVLATEVTVRQMGKALWWYTSKPPEQWPDDLQLALRCMTGARLTLPPVVSLITCRTIYTVCAFQ